MSSPLTTTDIRHSNKVRILQYIKLKTETTKPEIAKELKISIPTVSSLVDSLVKDGYVKECGKGESTFHGGKRPQLLTFNPLGRGIIAIHISSTVITGALIDLNANTLYKTQKSIKGCKGKESLSVIESVVAEFVKVANELEIELLGIGGGVPGLVDQHSGTIQKSLHFNDLTGVNLGELLSSRFQLPVWIDNEDNNFALAEKWLGLGRDVNSFVSLITDIGIGAGIIIDERLVRGVDNSFGEVGHTIISFDGPICSCGNRGCWETYASSSALLKQIEYQLEYTSILKDLVKENNSITVKQIVKAIELGDHLVEKIAIKELGKYLGLGIVNLVNIFNPEMVILYGEINQLGDRLLKEIQYWLDERALAAPANRVKIRFSTLGENVHILGAAALVNMESFNKPEYLFSNR
ncbi:ROK family transcriptional regulator [Fredinandcohnia sp. QZ13]|uniref:ROK family transcriptional regulator n=1 Tax=Fredinandcohnia sp. QZ13 TaxID=3073144 RepID=UPI002852F796|nr:ROK family transcriptional regulator [Fredinandcohnia sp. QZ13]MDR4887490.1 ROK family transcriptional regulator [Fredinandcohnia sp. QZ13]